MSSQETIGGAGGVSARTERLQRELAAARRALARPTSPVDEVLESVADQLLIELAREAEGPARITPGEEESPEVFVPRRVHHHAGNA